MSVTEPFVRQLLYPNVRLFGTVDDRMFKECIAGIERVLAGDGPLILELSTCGGEAETGRRIALEVKLLRERLGRETYFIGKTNVYSAGVTIMSGFELKDRFLSADCLLLIHDRRLDKQVHFTGSLRSNVAAAQEMLAQLQSGMALEIEGFEDLARGSKLSAEEVQEKAQANWYLSAKDALEIGLIAGII